MQISESVTMHHKPSDSHYLTQRYNILICEHRISFKNSPDYVTGMVSVKSTSREEAKPTTINKKSKVEKEKYRKNYHSFF